MLQEVDYRDYLEYGYSYQYAHGPGAVPYAMSSKHIFCDGKFKKNWVKNKSKNLQLSTCLSPLMMIMNWRLNVTGTWSFMEIMWQVTWSPMKSMRQVIQFQLGADDGSPDPWWGACDRSKFKTLCVAKCILLMFSICNINTASCFSQQGVGLGFLSQDVRQWNLGYH